VDAFFSNLFSLQKVLQHPGRGRGMKATPPEKHEFRETYPPARESPIEEGRA